MCYRIPTETHNRGTGHILFPGGGWDPPCSMSDEVPLSAMPPSPSLDPDECHEGARQLTFALLYGPVVQFAQQQPGKPPPSIVAMPPQLPLSVDPVLVFPAKAVLPESLAHFCFAPILKLHEPSELSFTLTDSSGTELYGVSLQVATQPTAPRGRTQRPAGTRGQEHADVPVRLSPPPSLSRSSASTSPAIGRLRRRSTGLSRSASSQAALSSALSRASCTCSCRWCSRRSGCPRPSSPSSSTSASAAISTASGSSCRQTRP